MQGYFIYFCKIYSSEAGNKKGIAASNSYALAGSVVLRAKPARAFKLAKYGINARAIYFLSKYLALILDLTYVIDP